MGVLFFLLSKGHIVTATFDNSIRDLFYKCDEESLKRGPQGPFSTATRSLLVANILKDIYVEQIALDHKGVLGAIKANTMKIIKSISESKKGSFTHDPNYRIRTHSWL